jgi:hypothetical protein
VKKSETTLGDLFPMTVEEVKERLSSVVKADPGQVQGLTSHVLEMAIGEAAKRFADLLEVSLVDIMAGAWYKYAALLQYADRKKYPQSESIVVPLAKHVINSSHSPGIEVLVGETPVVRLKLTVKLSMEMKGAMLRIQGGRIMEIEPGEVRAEGTIKFGEVVLAERKSAAVKLPGSIDLGAGIEIKPHAA